MEMGGIFFKNLELYPPLQLGLGEYLTDYLSVSYDNGKCRKYVKLTLFYRKVQIVTRRRCFDIFFYLLLGILVVQITAIFQLNRRMWLVVYGSRIGTTWN